MATAIKYDTSRARGEEHGPSERDRLLVQQDEQQDAASEPQHSVPTSITRRLYVSHFLSIWNSRVFEFGAVLYLATIFPSTLLPMSAYAFTRGLSALVFAPAVGQYIDTGDRLKVVRTSIIVQRLAVAASCSVFYLLSMQVVNKNDARTGMLVLLAALSCFEKLCSIMNLVSVERDWVVVIANKDEEALRTLNAQMRRIDLLCKLFGPPFIALADGISTEVAILVNFAMNVASVIVEYFAIARVYYDVPGLQESKKKMTQATEGTVAESPRRNEGLDLSFAHNWKHMKEVVAKSAVDFNRYFHHRAFLPSIAGALLYLTVLSFAGQMVTYLLSTGYTSTQIGIARTFGVAFEVLATWVGPWLMSRIGPIRAGLWSSTWQVTMLVGGIAVFWACKNQPVVSAGGLVVGTVLSRVGLRSFDLCTQLIVQEVSPTQRYCFEGQEELIVLIGCGSGESRRVFLCRSSLAKRF